MREDIEFLVDLQRKMDIQDTDGQASPRFWVVRDYKWTMGNENIYDRVSLYSCEEDWVLSTDEYAYEILNGDRHDDFNSEQIRQLVDAVCEDDNDGILRWAREYDNKGIEKVYEVKMDYIVPNTLFITKEECLEHIKLNHYHYTRDAHSYAMTAWRSPSVRKLWQVIENMNWKDILKEV